MSLSTRTALGMTEVLKLSEKALFLVTILNIIGMCQPEDRVRNICNEVGVRCGWGCIIHFFSFGQVPQGAPPNSRALGHDSRLMTMVTPVCTVRRYTITFFLPASCGPPNEPTLYKKSRLHTTYIMRMLAREIFLFSFHT